METAKMTKVLIALNYDIPSKKVAEVGFSMAKAMNAEVILLHVTSDPVYFSSTAYPPISGLTDSPDMDPLEFDSDDRLKKASQHFLDCSKRQLGDTSIQTLVKDGDFAETILKTAKEQQADVIIVGSQKRGRFGNKMMGSVTERVLQHSTIPLIIIPAQHTD